MKTLKSNKKNQANAVGSATTRASNKILDNVTDLQDNKTKTLNDLKATREEILTSVGKFLEDKSAIGSPNLLLLVDLVGILTDYNNINVATYGYSTIATNSQLLTKVLELHNLFSLDDPSFTGIDKTLKGIISDATLLLSKH